MRGKRQHGSTDCGVAFPLEDLDVNIWNAAKVREGVQLEKTAGLTPSGAREGNLSYGSTPWQMRADGCLWIGTPSFLFFDSASYSD